MSEKVYHKERYFKTLHSQYFFIMTTTSMLIWVEIHFRIRSKLRVPSLVCFLRTFESAAQVTTVLSLSVVERTPVKKGRRKSLLSSPHYHQRQFPTNYNNKENSNPAAEKAFKSTSFSRTFFSPWKTKFCISKYEQFISCMIKHLNIYKCFQSELHLKQQVHFVHSRGVNFTHKFQAL